nr:immunoglobulin light chain junction region [Macaca mulatta]
CQHGYGTPRTF